MLGRGMTTVWVKVTLGLLALLTGLVAVTHILPHAASPLLGLLASQPDCAMPCWIGIRPGKTAYYDAMTLLQNNPHITNIDSRQTIYASTQRFAWYIYWTWDNEGEPPVKGSLLVQDGIVRRVRIYSLTFGTLWTLLDRPEQGLFVGTLMYRDRLPVLAPLYHVAIYPGSGITIQTDASCAAFWWQPSMLTVGNISEQGDSYDLPAYRRYACKGRSA
jgi:hypothetical protein